MNRDIVFFFLLFQVLLLENLFLSNKLCLLLGLINIYLIGTHLLCLSTARFSSKLQVTMVGMSYVLFRLIYSAEFIVGPSPHIYVPDFVQGIISPYFSDA